MSSSAIRVVVWSTGGIGSIAVRAVAENPGTDLVGVWVHSPEKAGRDAGELVGIGPIGVTTTNDADELIALQPECVVYAAAGPEGGKYHSGWGEFQIASAFVRHL